MARYIVKISGSNAVDPWASAGNLSFRVAVDDVVCVEGDPDATGIPTLSPALFASRESAQAVALACRWSGQTYSVQSARGSVLARGVDVTLPADTRVTSCQESYGR